jgi:hypothetical protein
MFWHAGHGREREFLQRIPAGAIDPTPTIGMLGLIDDPKHITTQWFKGAGDAVLLIGEIGDELGGSEYLKRIHGLKTGGRRGWIWRSRKGCRISCWKSFARAG